MQNYFISLVWWNIATLTLNFTSLADKWWFFIVKPLPLFTNQKGKPSKSTVKTVKTIRDIYRKIDKPSLKAKLSAMRISLLVFWTNYNVIWLIKNIVHNRSRLSPIITSSIRNSMLQNSSLPSVSIGGIHADKSQNGT